LNRSDAFDALVLSAYRALARLAYLMCGDEATAEDIVAEAFARSWTPWRHGTVEDLGPYVRRTVVNLCLQGQRRRLLERRAFERVRSRPEATPGDQATNHDRNAVCASPGPSVASSRSCPSGSAIGS
jgi:DNA-directed RNA polymerase specialized sigma24 family protein